MSTDSTLPHKTSKDDASESANETPCPIQIVEIGSEEDKYAFTFKEEEFFAILAKVPPGWKISVVSVVGAFRTGKSFLLSWFLRFLDYHYAEKKNVDVPVDKPIVVVRTSW